MPRPKQDPENWKRLGVRVPPEIHDWLWAEAQKNFRSIGGQVTFIILRYHYLEGTNNTLLKALLKKYQLGDNETDA